MTDVFSGELVPNADGNIAVAREAIRQGADVLRRFIGNLGDLGIQAQLLEVLTYALPGTNDDTPKAIFNQALSDVVEISIFGDIGEFDGQKVIEGAVSLELLVRYARMLNEQRPLVFLAEDIPSPELIDSCLQLFQLLNRQRLQAGTSAG